MLGVCSEFFLEEGGLFMVYSFWRLVFLGGLKVLRPGFYRRRHREIITKES